MSDDRTPILVGAGQFTQRGVEPSEALDPLGMMVETARRAAADAGLAARALEQLDTIAVVNIFGWHYNNVSRLLAERLPARPRQELYTTVGGNTPQFLVNEVAERIAAGRVRFALLAGAEAIDTVQRARRAGVELSWPSGGEGEPEILGDSRPGTTDHEMTHGLILPTTIYPLFENAFRTHCGISLEEHRRRLGELCGRMSAIAAGNPYAWFRDARSAAEITTVRPENRMVGFPYPKYMNAIIAVDQAAALLMTTVSAAREMGIDPSRWVYLHGAADAHDLWFLSDRVNYHSSPAIRMAGAAALRLAGTDVSAIEAFDLYSCFPCAVQIAREMLGVAADDPRPVTVTGGLPYHGGPGNNYSMHGIATMMERLRSKPGTRGLVSALGWYMTKHAVGVYGTDPPPTTPAARVARDLQAQIDAADHPVLACEASGKGTIETYTVLHDRDGSPMRGIVIGRLDDGRRFLANTASERDVLESLMAAEAVGRPGKARRDGETNLFELT